MAGTIKGITIEIGANTQPLNKALEGVNTKSKDLQSELKQVERLLKLDPTNTELLAQKQGLLTNAVGNTKEKLDVLKTAQKQAADQFKNGDIGEEQFRALQREIISTETNLKSLEKQAKTTGTGISTSMTDAGDKLTSVGKKMSVASVAITAGVGAATASALESADSLVKLSDKTGLSLESLQELKFVGGQVGVELDTIAGAQAKLTKSMVAASGGTGTQADAFRTLKVDAIDPTTGALRDVKDVMGEAFTALGNVGNETERDAIAMAIFGKSATELNPIIKLGSDGLAEMKQQAHDTGSVMSDETVKSLDDFGDSTEALQGSVTAAIGASLTPLMEKLTDLTKWFSNLSDGTKTTILIFVGIIAIMGPLLMILGQVATGIGLLTTFFAAGGAAAGIWSGVCGVASVATTALGAAFTFLLSPIGLIILAIAAVIAIGVLLYKNWDTVKEYTVAAFTAIGDFIQFSIDKVVAIFMAVIDFVKNNWQEILLFIANPFAGAFALLYKHCDGFREKVDSVFSWVKDFIGGIIADVKGFFDFSWSLPDLKMPHFSITGDFDINPFDGDGVSVPKIGVDWYAKGGIFTGPSIIGVGENPASRGEAVIPLEKLDSMLKNNSGGDIYLQNITTLNGRVLTDEVKKMTVRTDRLQNA